MKWLRICIQRLVLSRGCPKSAKKLNENGSHLEFLINTWCYHIDNIPIGFSDIENVGVDTKFVFLGWPKTEIVHGNPSGPMDYDIQAIIDRRGAIVSCANGLCYYITPMCYLFIMSDFRTLPSYHLSSFYYIVRQGYANGIFCSDIVVGTSVALRHHLYAFPTRQRSLSFLEL